MIFKMKSKHIISKTRKHKQKYGTVVKEYEFIKPDNDSMNYITNDTTKDWRKKNFHSLGNRCVYAIKFTNIANNVEVILTIIIGYM